MFVIGQVTVEEPVAGSHFACDLHQCKGGCCTLPGGRGAPLEDDEVHAIEGAFPHAAKYLSKRHAEDIRTVGAVEGVPGSYATRCIDNKECVFVFYDEGIARCSIEKAYFDGAIGFRKPISCHLFPVRVSSNGSPRIRYEKITECDAARLRGRKEKIRLHGFLKEALIRKFGAQWYGEFEAACQERRDL